MSTKIIAIVVAIVLIAGGAWYFTQNRTSDQTKNQYGQIEPEESLGQTSASLQELLKSGKDQKCTFATENEGVTGTGTFYIAGGKSRGIISSKVDDIDKVTSNILYDGDMSYMWSEGSNTGFKFKVNEQEAKQAQDQAKGSIDPNAKFDVKCEKWSVDNSLFSVPSNVNFQEFAVPTMPSATADTPQNQDINPADICASLPEPAKSQCLANIKR